MTSKIDTTQLIAKKIQDLGLTATAVFLLEAHKPLSFLGSQFLLVAQPTLNLFLPHNITANTINLLSNPTELETLIKLLEAPQSKTKSNEIVDPQPEKINTSMAKKVGRL